MNKFLGICILLTLFLFGCGGGGGNPGACSGSAIYCAEAAGSGGGTSGTTGGSSVPVNLFTKSGTGDTVFEIPAGVTRIRIQGTFTGSGSNFIVDIASKGVVNAIIGDSRDPVSFDGT